MKCCHYANMVENVPVPGSGNAADINVRLRSLSILSFKYTSFLTPSIPSSDQTQLAEVGIQAAAECNFQ